MADHSSPPPQIPSQETLDSLLKAAETHLIHKRFAPLGDVLARAAARAPDDWRVLHLQGLSAFEQRDARTAHGFLSRALQHQPRNPMLQHNMAAVLISLGAFAKAETLLQAAIAQKPDYAEAYHTLAPIHRFTADDPLIPLMEQGLETPGLTPTDTSFYAFALAQACDQAGLYDKVWPALTRANAAMPHRFDGPAQAAALDVLIDKTPRTRLQELRQYGHPSTAPILIVGLPRSGTTLLESVLSEHPQVHGAGELTLLGAVGRSMAARLGTAEAAVGHGPVFDALTPPHAYAAGLGYLNGARATAQGWFDRFVDKLPDNSFNLGLAAVLIPNAAVIHIMRHPLDVMLSIYLQRFTSVKYSFRPQDIIQHYQDYRRVMAHWRSALPRPMLELRYENLVQDVDRARALLWERLGLSAQVDHVPHAPRTGEQRTASRFQVRQPVHRNSREKFRRYEAQMAAFIAGAGGMDAIEAEVAAQEARCFLRAATAG